MKWAVSPFKNEVDVLEIRLASIADMVDVVVLAESTVDQRGRPRDLVFTRHLDRFAPWMDKIRYVVVSDMPTGEGHELDVARERFQRDAIIRGMWDLQEDDLVYISDLDEIPSVEALEDGFANPPLRFGMDLHVYALNWRWLDRGCRIGTLGAVVTGESILRQGVCGAVLWDSDVRQRPGVSGWHLTYQGGVEMIRDKITGMMDKYESLCMPGVDPSEVLTDDWILNSIYHGDDIYGRTYRPSEWVDVEDMPIAVQADPGRYAHMMVPKPPGQDEIESRPRCTCGGVFQGEELGHFQYCALSGMPSMAIVGADDRQQPRSLGV